MTLISGIVGKPNVGKSTFFSAATMMNVAIANYPFTTINANIGTGYIRVKCVHEEFDVKDTPVNSACIEGTRLIPVKMVDIAGLVPDASKGRGLGNKFLDDLRQADALIHVVDASGSSDEEGRPVPPGTHDVIKDIEFVRHEVIQWIKSLIEKDWSRISRSVESGAAGSPDLASELSQKLSGLSIMRTGIEAAIHKTHLKEDKPTTWSDEDLYEFVSVLLDSSKPTLIAANKCDQETAKNGLSRIKEHFKESNKVAIVPCAAEAELLLRRASQSGLISYIPGDSFFKLIEPSKITSSQKKALDLVQKTVLDVFKNTGVQKAINDAYLSLLQGIVVYPVEDETKLSDKKGNVLPDARILHRGDTAKDLAFAVHSDLGNSFLYAIDVRSGLRVGADYELKNNDVLKIVSAAKKG